MSLTKTQRAVLESVKDLKWELDAWGHVRASGFTLGVFLWHLGFGKFWMACPVAAAANRKLGENLFGGDAWAANSEADLGLTEVEVNALAFGADGTGPHVQEIRDILGVRT